ALDPRAEDALFQAIRGRQGQRTTILITHRLANVRHADRIFVLHEGRLTEQGRHDELVAAGGRYAELFTLQASGYLEPAGPPPRCLPGRGRSSARDYSPMLPSMASRRKSAWPRWRAYSLIR